VSLEAPASAAQAEGHDLHAHTGSFNWLGEQLDVGYAIDVLHPLACRGAG